MMEVLEGVKNQTHGKWERIFRKPISAGFITATDTGIYCHGDSQTLGLSCRTKEDNEHLKKML